MLILPSLRVIVIIVEIIVIALIIILIALVIIVILIPFLISIIHTIENINNHYLELIHVRVNLLFIAQVTLIMI